MEEVSQTIEGSRGKGLPRNPWAMTLRERADEIRSLLSGHSMSVHEWGSEPSKVVVICFYEALTNQDARDTGKRIGLLLECNMFGHSSARAILQPYHYDEDGPGSLEGCMDVVVQDSEILRRILLLAGAEGVFYLPSLRETVLARSANQSHRSRVESEERA